PDRDRDDGQRVANLRHFVLLLVHLGCVFWPIVLEAGGCAGIDLPGTVPAPFLDNRSAHVVGLDRDGDIVDRLLLILRNDRRRFLAGVLVLLLIVLIV